MGLRALLWYQRSALRHVELVQVEAARARFDPTGFTAQLSTVDRRVCSWQGEQPPVRLAGPQALLQLRYRHPPEGVDSPEHGADSDCGRSSGTDQSLSNNRLCWPPEVRP
jgi:hypothetical protein